MLNSFAYHYLRLHYCKHVVYCCTLLLALVLTTITSICMAPSDPVTFPKSKLTKTLLGRIVQLEFELSPSETIGMMTVSAFINLMPRNDNNPYPWCEIPMLYHKALEIAIFRYEILKIAATDNVAQGGNKVHILCANLNLAYMDRILSRLFKDARAQPGSINVNWRHEQFDEWTCTEFHVRKHSPDDISAWKLLHPGVSLTLGAIDALGFVTLILFSFGYMNLTTTFNKIGICMTLRSMNG